MSVYKYKNVVKKSVFYVSLLLSEASLIAMEDDHKHHQVIKNVKYYASPAGQRKLAELPQKKGSPINLGNDQQRADDLQFKHQLRNAR